MTAKGAAFMNWDENAFFADPNYSVLFLCENDMIEVRNDAKSGTLAFKNKIPFNDKLIDAIYFKVPLDYYLTVVE